MQHAHHCTLNKPHHQELRLDLAQLFLFNRIESKNVYLTASEEMLVVLAYAC